eukprot:1049039-Pyramimonas_sp.AAC.1
MTGNCAGRVSMHRKRTTSTACTRSSCASPNRYSASGVRPSASTFSAAVNARAPAPSAARACASNVRIHHPRA